MTAPTSPNDALAAPDLSPQISPVKPQPVTLLPRNTKAPNTPTPFVPASRLPREMSVGDMRATLSKLSSPATGFLHGQHPSIESLAAVLSRQSVESHHTSPTVTLRGSYMSATPHHALFHTTTNTVTPTTKPNPRVVRRTKSSGAPLLCGIFSKNKELANFSDLQQELNGGNGKAVHIAVNVVQEEWKSGEAKGHGGSVKRKSRLSVVIGRMRSGSDANKIGVAI
ncbi:hypothetical protein FRB94_001172 [Tulasnella sp. JGI-2019a]|nr:hypothetical protein FRB94_001172 [Tulasnella sp. JGI-2019a]